MLTTSDFKKGVRIEVDGEPLLIVDVQSQTPQGRASNFLVRVRARNLRTGQLVDKTFRGGDKVDVPDFALRSVQFLYRADDGGGDGNEDAAEFHFMDQESFEQFHLTGGQLGEQRYYLTEGLSGVRSMLHNGEVIGIEVPHTVELTVSETEPTIKGATATATTKPARLHTGLTIQVPGYIEGGDVVKVDTREARFIERLRRG
jgi:elongation factor P